MKAIILSAGQGNRLKPLTQHTPKPLIPVGDKRLIEYHLENLRDIDVTDIVINIRHLAEEFPKVLGTGEKYQVNIHYSQEYEDLETGGGILNAMPLLGNEPFIVINGDIWTDYPLKNLLTALEPNKLAHFVLVNNPPDVSQGDFGLDPGSRRPNFNKQYTFAGISVFHPNLFKDCQPGPFRHPDLLRAAMIKHQVTAEHYPGAWFPIDTAERLQRLRDYIANQ